MRIVRNQFASDLDSIDKALEEYRGYLQRKLNAGSPMADDQHESETVCRIEPALERLRLKTCDSDWVVNDLQLDQLRDELENLQTLTAALPSHLYEKMSGFADEVRSQYRTLIIGMWTASVSAGLVFTLWIKLFYQWIFRPLRTLIGGSRKWPPGNSATVFVSTRKTKWPSWPRP